MKVARSFIQGLTVHSRGARTLRSVSGAWKYLIVPFFADMVLLVMGVVWGAPWIAAQVKAWTLHFSLWGPLESLLSWVFLLLAWAVALIIWLMIVYLVASLIALPFYSTLAEHVVGKLGLQPQFKGGWGTFVHMMKVGLVKSVVFLVLAVLLFVLAFIPGLNVIAVFGSMVIVAADSLDYTFEALRYSFRDRRKLWGQHFPFLLGVAAALVLTSLVPGLTLFLQPLVILGCLEYFVDQLRSGRVQE